MIPTFTKYTEEAKPMQELRRKSQEDKGRTMESEIKKSSNGLLQEWEGTVTVQNVMKRSSPISAKNGY